jgi:hypothetical protein
LASFHNTHDQQPRVSYLCLGQHRWRTILDADNVMECPMESPIGKAVLRHGLADHSNMSAAAIQKNKPMAREPGFPLRTG